MAVPRTSTTSPLRIDAVPANDGGGMIGMTICPGKRGDSQYGTTWERDLAVDLDAIRDWGANALVTLMEPDEMQRLGVAGLGSAAMKAKLDWLHIPIADGEIPDERFQRAWPTAGPALLQDLTAGNRVVIHCRGGLGRTGTVTCLLLIEKGTAPADALEIVRRARPGAVETSEQEAFVLNYRRHF